MFICLSFGGLLFSEEETNDNGCGREEGEWELRGFEGGETDVGYTA